MAEPAEETAVLTVEGSGLTLAERYAVAAAFVSVELPAGFTVEFDFSDD